MNMYNNLILPHLVHKVCSGKEFMKLREQKVKSLSGIGLEIGAGSGLNFRYYQNIEKLYVIEPCLKSRELSKIEAVKYDLNIEFIDYATDGSINLLNNLLSFIVSTWTLCTIYNVEFVLRDSRRLLKENAEFHFLEHGISPDRTIKFYQNLLNPVQKRIGGGCHLNRDISHIVINSGYKLMHLKEFYMPGIRIGSYIYSGVAVAF